MQKLKNVNLLSEGGKFKMRVRDLLANEDFEILTGDIGLEKEIAGAFVGDLLSIVMSKAHENNAWLTIQTHLNIIAVATLIEMAVIIIVEDMDVPRETIDKAIEECVPILKTKLAAYDVAKLLVEVGV